MSLHSSVNNSLFLLEIVGRVHLFNILNDQRDYYDNYYYYNYSNNNNKCNVCFLVNIQPVCFFFPKAFTYPGHIPSAVLANNWCIVWLKWDAKPETCKCLETCLCLLNN